MKRLAKGIALAACLAASTGAARAATSAETLAGFLSGIWVGSTPNNSLRLTITEITTDPVNARDLFLAVSGKFETDAVRQQGVIRLESQGPNVYWGYVPHFDPTITALSPGAASFTQPEADAACGFVLNAKGDGYAGDTLGSQCARAMRGALRKWVIEVEPGTIRLQDPKSGETLRFRKLEKGESEAPAKK